MLALKERAVKVLDFRLLIGLVDYLTVDNKCGKCVETVAHVICERPREIR